MLHPPPLHEFSGLGGAFDLYASAGFGVALWHWDGGPGATFNIAWGVMICVLVYGDLKQTGVLR